MGKRRSPGYESELTLIKQALESAESCKYCVGLSGTPDDVTPIACVKFSGSMIPIYINPAACLSCPEFLRKYPAFNPDSPSAN
jgi:hypothetical protein